MKIFVCTRVNDKDADTYAHNAKLVSRAMILGEYAYLNERSQKIGTNRNCC